MSKASEIPKGAIAVIFTSRRTGRDAEGYAEAAAAMEAEAARQPGYLGIESVSNAAGAGITVSYWADEAAAIAWRDHAEHAATRERGRAEWYAGYHLLVAQVVRGYRWGE
jgi:heme-degrading monooxygenase HmoA